MPDVLSREEVDALLNVVDSANAERAAEEAAEMAGRGTPPKFKYYYIFEDGSVKGANVDPSEGDLKAADEGFVTIIDAEDGLMRPSEDGDDHWKAIEEARNG